MNYSTRLAAALLSLFVVTSAQAEDLHQGDNTARNKQKATTADSQALSVDNELLASIRRDIVDDASLSTYAHNVKIISSDQKIVLQGPVRSINEKLKVEQIASRHFKQGIVNNLEVVPSENG